MRHLQEFLGVFVFGSFICDNLIWIREAIVRGLQIVSRAVRQLVNGTKSEIGTQFYQSLSNASTYTYKAQILVKLKTFWPTSNIHI